MTSLKMDGFAKRLEEATTVGPKQIAPGIVLKVMDKYGNQLYEASAGTYGLKSTQQVHPETLMWIASQTKILAAACAMKVVEDGLWKLDDPVETILPELKDLPIINAEGDIIKERSDNKITLRHLLTHTSGMTYPLLHPGVQSWRKSKNLSHGLDVWQDGIDKFPNGPLLFEPGHGWTYGTGLDWTGVLISRVAKVPFDQYLQENICKPLGMTSTMFDPSKRFDDWQDRLMTLTTVMPGTEGAALVTIPQPCPLPAPYDYGGHGGFSTPSDYSKFLIMLLRNGEGADGTRILKKETVDEMFRPQLSGDDLKAFQESVDSGPLASMIGPGVTADYNRGKKVNYGLSGMINLEDYKEGRKAGSLCWSGMPNCYWWVDRETGIAGNLSTQLFPTGEGPIVDFLEEFHQAVYNELAA